MIRLLTVEARKLNRSLVLLLAATAPTLVAVFAFFNMLRFEEPQPWAMWLQGTAAIWAFFMLPMSVTALTALVAHMEHGPRAWDQLRALPIARWRIYAAKAICVLVLIAGMSLANLALTIGAIHLATAVKPELAPTGTLDLAGNLITTGKVAAAALLLTAIQFWTAMRWSSFVPALALGIGGTFFAVVATAAKQGVFFPWQMPINMLATDAWRVETALVLGAGLGLCVFAAAIIHLAGREPA